MCLISERGEVGAFIGPTYRGKNVLQGVRLENLSRAPSRCFFNCCYTLLPRPRAVLRLVFCIDSLTGSSSPDLSKRVDASSNYSLFSWYILSVARLESHSDRWLDSMSLADVPAASPIMDPSYTGPSASLAAAASGIRAILRRTHSLGYHHGSQYFQNNDPADQDEDRDRYARDRTHSPVRANSKRRRSVASTFCPGIGARHARYASDKIDAPQIELFSVDH